TLETMKDRLTQLRDGMPVSENIAEDLINDEEIEEDLLDEMLEGTSDEAPPEVADVKPSRAAVESEISELVRYSQWARSIGVDTKSRSLLKALNVGFSELEKMSANRKALIFTESRRTQEYLKNFLEANGYGGQIV